MFSSLFLAAAASPSSRASALRIDLSWSSDLTFPRMGASTQLIRQTISHYCVHERLGGGALEMQGYD
jgi:hypothetical protein